MLEHHVLGEVAQLQVARGSVEERLLGDEADDFAPRGRHAVRLGLALHQLEGAIDGGLFRVHEVHGDLRLAVHFEAESLHVAQPAARAAHGLGHCLGHRHVLGAAEIDVVRDEEGAGADDGGASGGMHMIGAEVRHALGIGADLRLGQLKLAAADVGEVLAVGARGGALVQEDRNAEFIADALAEGAREGDAVVHGGALERNERADVGGADARVFAGVRVEVNELGGLGDATEGGVHGGLGGGDDGHDRPIVRRIAGHIEDSDALAVGDGVTDGRDHLGAAAFGEVGDEFDELHMTTIEDLESGFR